MSRKEKLLDIQQEQLVNMAREGCPSAVLSETFGISRPTVTRILKNHGINRKVGKEPCEKIFYYEDPVITLTKESHEYVLSELKKHGISTIYMLSKYCGISKDVAYSFFTNAEIPMGILKNILKQYHMYVVFVPTKKDAETSAEI